MVNCDGDVMMEIKAQIGAANGCCFSFKKHLGSKLSSHKVKYVTYKTIKPYMGPRFGLWINMVRIFLDPLRGKFCRQHLVWYLKMDVGGDARTLKYVRCVMNKL